MKGDHKFKPLQDYLEQCNLEVVNLTFKEIEEIIGDKLCDSAYKWEAYWNPNRPLVWKDIGYKMSKNRKNQTITLSRIDSISNEYDEINLELNNIDDKYKESVSKLRIGQGKYRDGLISKHGCKCMMCDIKLKELLIASHIKEFSISTKSESIDLNNGLLLCANHDKLFDRHLISFDNKGKIMISDKIKLTDYEELKINENICINMDEKIDKYMAYHRKLIE